MNLENNILDEKDISLYKPSPTFVKFHSNSNNYRIVIGSVGGGKTVGSCMEVFTRCLEMPICIDGKRRARWIICRNTYPELETTTIKTWREWFPDDAYGRFISSHPLQHRMNFIDDKDVECEFEIYFVALSDMNVFRKVLGMEITGVFFNEIREIDGDLVRGVFQRVGRYPKKHLPRGVDYWYGVIGDTNPPAEDSWLYRLIEEEKPEGWSFFWQPSAMLEVGKDTYIVNPAAENTQNLVKGYYERQTQIMSREEVKVYLLNKYGTIHSGVRCHTDFNLQVHRSQNEMFADPMFPVYLGWDFGLTPCVVIAQYISGQLRVLEEFQAFDTHLEDFLNIIFLPVWRSKYASWATSGKYVSKGDPFGGGKRQDTDGQTTIKQINEAGIVTTGVKFKQYGIQRRHSSVNHFLRNMAKGEPAFIINHQCRYLIKGFDGMYKFAEKIASGIKYTSEQIENNEYTHSQDALQAICLHLLDNPSTLDSAKKFQVQTVFNANPAPF